MGWIFVIRPSRIDDGPTLLGVEQQAGERFREVGLDFVADDDPGSAHELAAYASAGRGWVAADDADEPVGYVIADVVDGQAHVEQVSVLPQYQGLGIGRALLDQVEQWAIGQGIQTLTLTTFDRVPWNRPLYEHLGFRVLADGEFGPELRAIRDAETARGLDPATRVCMARPIDRQTR